MIASVLGWAVGQWPGWFNACLQLWWGPAVVMHLLSFFLPPSSSLLPFSFLDPVERSSLRDRKHICDLQTWRGISRSYLTNCFTKDKQQKHTTQIIEKLVKQIKQNVIICLFYFTNTDEIFNVFPFCKYMLFLNVIPAKSWETPVGNSPQVNRLIGNRWWY